MPGRRTLGDELRRVADDYVRDNPADLSRVRAAVERRRQRLRFAMAGGAVAVAAVSTLLFFSFTGTIDSSLDEIKPAESPEASPTVELRVTKEIALGVTPSQVASGSGAAYVTSSTSGVVLAVDLDAGEVVADRRLGAPKDIIHDGSTGSVWVTDPSGRSIHRLSSRSLKPTDAPLLLQNGDAPVRLTVTGNTLRVTGDSSGVVKIDLAGGQTPLVQEDVIDIAATGGRYLWVLTAAGEIRAVDSRTGADVGLPSVPVEAREDAEITFAKEGIWYGVRGSSSMLRVDAVSGEAREVTLPAGYWDLDADRNDLWILMRSSETNGLLAAVDPVTGEATERSIRIDGQPVDIATDGEGVWVVKAGTQSVVHIATFAGNI